MIGRILIAALFAVCCLPLAARAEQRALLVGVGKYVHPNIDLPGIDLDLERMRETLKLMGFSDRQIHTLQDEQATSTNVISEFGTWLREGVQPNDQVVFYFSGHGSNVPDLNGDETDGVDEVLVTHDMRFNRSKTHPLTGVVIDDKIGEMLDAIPSKHILVIVDACHSGTITRTLVLKNRSLGSEPVFVKSFNYPGMPLPLPRKTRLTRGLERNTTQMNFVSLTAAADTEAAIGTAHGGIFTIGLTEAAKRLSSERQSVTVKELRDAEAQYIRSKVDKDQVHTPQVNGNPNLATSALSFHHLAVADGLNRKKLLDLVAAQARHFDISSSSVKYAVDQPVKLTLTVPASGYLNLVSVDAKDNAIVLFPNRYQENNAVNAGPFELPTEQMAYEMLASEPLGPTLVVAFLSADPINFYHETLDNRDENGNITVDFPELSHGATRALRLAPRKRDTYASQLELDIVAAAPSKP
jgi:metacaspase-1